MSLEDVVKQYGMNDYYDFISGNLYKLSKAIDNGNGTLKVPVENGEKIVGYAIMKKPEE